MSAEDFAAVEVVTILDSLEAAEAKATPTGWYVDATDNSLDVVAPKHAVATIWIHLAGPMTMGDDAIPSVKESALADAALIALLRNHAADLIAVARAAQAYIRPDVWIEGHPLHGASIFPDLNSSTTSEALRDALAPLIAEGSE